MGSKYEFKPDKNPPVGAYDIQSGLNASLTQSRSAHIKEETSPYRRAQDQTPGPGEHDGHLTKFGSNIKPNVYVNSKYRNNYLDTPPPGLYDPNDKVLSTR